MSTDARQPGPITFGELLSRAWRMYRAEPLLFLILTAVTVIPVGILSGIASARKRRGRPAGSGTKEQVAIRLDHDVLAAFRTGGPGWQTRMNEALKDWLRTNSAV